MGRTTHPRQMAGGALGEGAAGARHGRRAAQDAGVYRTLDKAGPSPWARLVGHVGRRDAPSVGTIEPQSHPQNDGVAPVVKAEPRPNYVW
jgi:hypothetical protein